MTPKPERDFPWWLVVLALAGAGFALAVARDPLHAKIFSMLAKGIGVTLFVTLVAFAGALVAGLGLALAALSRALVLRQLARLYTEVIRGVPIIVLLLYVAFALVPLAIAGWNALGLPPVSVRDVPLLARAILALILAYSAFLAEVFRAGLLSVDPGQIEAAKALGLSRGQRFRLIVLPQALRTILPPLGNDFVAMVKDSSLVSVLGVADVTQLGKVAAAGNFRYFETYNLVALIYLALTITLSLLLRKLEAHLRRRGPGAD
ncbi:amino acid ABC transporter permease [Rhodobacter lacus]|uniref:Amino acid ABC transporter permease n=1 Tax=Rhodobacter lacus TaxID=1641972 RepID=A0ABW5A8V4_9RHOB